MARRTSCSRNREKNDVLIKISKTAICKTDIHIYNWDKLVHKTIPVPMAVGHEFVGMVSGFGSNVHDFAVGDIVSGEGHIICGFCNQMFGIATPRYLQTYFQFSTRLETLLTQH